MTQCELWLPEGALCSVQPAGSGGAGAGGRTGMSAIAQNSTAEMSFLFCFLAQELRGSAKMRWVMEK
jgi:hypothetical protein